MADSMLDVLMEPHQADSGEFIAVVTDKTEALLATQNPGSAEHVWVKHLGTDVALLWSAYWHAGGYALRIRRDMLAPLGRALLAAAESDADGVLVHPASSREETNE